ncbi:GNAT family N-acetyltransferase [uncultured Nocardioides sp.]|uniref:GNAT family N-acetyltransferase n=1 Tax=uncultured Nocardioides sp. TaxID=198441 RepID=UPI00261488FC|nr:GNAT family N-acetyltransferase [uncultured Nocardioides sp.]
MTVAPDPSSVASDLQWVREESPTWDADKVRVIGGAPEGAFVLPFSDGEQLPGDWFSARDAGGAVVGYGRLDTTWGGDAEILLAVDPGHQEAGVGSFVLERLEAEAAARDINYIHNRIRDHAQRDVVHDWLVVRGFRGPVDGDLRKRVGAGGRRPRPEARPASSAASGTPDGRGPGHEEQGGYVDVEEHQY